MTKSKGFKTFVIVVAGIFALGIIASLISWQTPAKNTGNSLFSFQSQVKPPANGPYIGVLYIEGIIQASYVSDPFTSGGYNHQWMLSEIDFLMSDSNNEALVLFIDSPGGGIYDTDELYLKVKEYQKMTGRPVYAAMGSMAASGGYYMAAAAEKVFANRNTLTGSIGVTMGTMYDISEFLSNYGIKTKTVTSGKNKAMGEMSSPLTEEQQMIFQSICDEAYEQFVGIVAEGRGLTQPEVVKLADGRIYTAKQAKELKLVDEIGTLQEAIADMKEKYDLYDCDSVDMYYEDNSFFSKLLQMQTNLRISGEMDMILKLTGKKEQMGLRSPVNYLYGY